MAIAAGIYGGGLIGILAVGAAFSATGKNDFEVDDNDYGIELDD